MLFSLSPEGVSGLRLSVCMETSSQCDLSIGFEMSFLFVSGVDLCEQGGICDWYAGPKTALRM